MRSTVSVIRSGVKVTPPGVRTGGRDDQPEDIEVAIAGAPAVAHMLGSSESRQTLDGDVVDQWKRPWGCRRHLYGLLPCGIDRGDIVWSQPPGEDQIGVVRLRTVWISNRSGSHRELSV